MRIGKLWVGRAERQVRNSVSLQSIAVNCYEQLKKLAVADGLWFCSPDNDGRTFSGWVIPPLTVDRDFAILANGTPVGIRPLDAVPRVMQDIFDRFTISDLSRRYTFTFSLPTFDVGTGDIALSCSLMDGPAGVFATYFQPGAAQVETPAFNMMRVAGTMDFGYFTLMGCTQYHHIKAMVQMYAPSSKTILDWGCGSARVLRYFAADPAFEVTGVDVDKYNIDWCKDTFGGQARFEVIEPVAACPFADQTFDVIYGISIFTHLNQASEQFWLAELRRLLKPGGIAVMTVHGELAFFKGINDVWQFSGLLENGFLDYGTCQDLDVDGKKTISADLYRNVFHTRPYLARVWGDHFRIIDYIPGGSTAHQDYVILQRRS